MKEVNENNVKTGNYEVRERYNENENESQTQWI